MKTYRLKDSQALNVRKAVESDAESILRNYTSVVEERQFLMTDQVIAAERRQKILGRIRAPEPEFLFIVAELKGNVIGELKLGPFSSSAKTSHVRNLGMEILRDYRSIGVGTALMDYAIGWCISIGIEKIVLDVFSTNAEAIRLYRKMGFECEGTNRKAARINGDYVDLINMGLMVPTG